MLKKILIKGAKEHNLKNISLEIPKDKFVVITGLSGSGKSSLAFDTVYAEGQRRYVESLSAYARQFLDKMKKPNVDLIEGLSPAISIEQKNTSKNPLFSIDKRIKLINEAINANNVDNTLIYAEAFDNLLIDFAKTNEVSIIIRGLRVVSDFDYEFQMAQMNFNLADFETIFIPASPEYGYVSSSMVKEIFSYGGDVNALVPSIVVERLKDV